MYVRIGIVSLNMAAIVAVEWSDSVGACDVFLQGRSEPETFTNEEYGQFKTAFDKLLQLEQVGEAIVQQQAAINQKEAQINQVWAQVQQEAAQQAIRKGGGLIKR